MAIYGTRNIYLTSELGFNPLTTAVMFVLKTADSAATAAAVLLVGTLVQSPIPNTLAGREETVVLINDHNYGKVAH